MAINPAGTEPIEDLIYALTLLKRAGAKTVSIAPGDPFQELTVHLPNMVFIEQDEWLSEELNRVGFFQHEEDLSRWVVVLDKEPL